MNRRTFFEMAAAALACLGLPINRAPAGFAYVPMERKGGLPPSMQLVRIAPATCVWKDRGSHDFSDPSNWEGGSVPRLGDTIVFGETNTPSLFKPVATDGQIQWIGFAGQGLNKLG